MWYQYLGAWLKERFCNVWLHSVGQIHYQTNAYVVILFKETDCKLCAILV